MMLHAKMHGSQRINSLSYGNPLTFHLVPIATKAESEGYNIFCATSPDELGDPIAHCFSWFPDDKFQILFSIYCCFWQIVCEYY